MATRPGVAKTIEEITAALPHLIRFPAAKTWIDYDEGADVLYVSFKRPQKATDTEFLESQGILLRYRNKELVGVTVLDASKRKNGDKKRFADMGAVEEKKETYGGKLTAKARRRRP
jgi:uncharacterized protein YuzE